MGFERFFHDWTVKDPGKRFAEILANNYKRIYREPGNVRVIPATALAELRRTKAPAVLIEVGYHDNRQDAQWIRDNIDTIARTLAQSVAEYFHQDFREP